MRKPDKLLSWLQLFRDSILIIKGLTSFPTHPLCTNVSPELGGLLFTSSYSHKWSPPPLFFIWLWNGSLTFRGNTFCLGDQDIHVIYLQRLSLRKWKKSILMCKVLHEMKTRSRGKNVITWFSLGSYWSWSLSHRCFNYLSLLEVQSWESNYVVVWETQVAIQGHDWADFLWFIRG